MGKSLVSCFLTHSVVAQGPVVTHEVRLSITNHFQN